MGEEKIPPRFRKTKTDKWAVMAPMVDLERVLAADGKIDVQKKSGGWSSFTVASLGKPFDVDGVKMCYGYAADDTDSGSSDSTTTATDAASPRSQNAEPRFDSDLTPPPSDPSEPLPEFQGDDSDWSEF